MWLLVLLPEELRGRPHICSRLLEAPRPTWVNSELLPSQPCAPPVCLGALDSTPDPLPGLPAGLCRPHVGVPMEGKGGSRWRERTHLLLLEAPCPVAAGGQAARTQDTAWSRPGRLPSRHLKVGVGGSEGNPHLDVQLPALLSALPLSSTCLHTSLLVILVVGQVLCRRQGCGPAARDLP